jgi:microcompartment protein CcmK/EutM
MYRLAGETITTKINKNLHHEKIIMQQKMQRQEEELESQQRML